MTTTAAATTKTKKRKATSKTGKCRRTADALSITLCGKRILQ